MGLVAVLVVPFAPRPADGEHPVPVASLAPGSCVRFPSKSADPKVRHEDSDGVALLREVVPVACTEPHRGEVVAQAALDPERLRYNDLSAASHAACREPFADYNPDFWALPANVGITLVPPREQDVAQHPLATCLYIGLSAPLAGPLRADPSRLTVGQRRYLDAVRPYDEVSADGLDARESIRNDQLTAWAKEMAAAEQRTLDELQRIGAPTGAEQPFAVVLDQHRKGAAAWQAAAAETTPKEIHRRMVDARDAEHAAMDADQAVRAALGLSTTMRPRGYSL
ncbi:hypothetical protein GCM10010441_42760 [Kitasatospora paracochleata]